MQHTTIPGESVGALSGRQVTDLSCTSPPCISHKRRVAETWDPAWGAGNNAFQVPPTFSGVSVGSHFCIAQVLDLIKRWIIHNCLLPHSDHIFDTLQRCGCHWTYFIGPLLEDGLQRGYVIHQLIIALL